MRRAAIILGIALLLAPTLAHAQNLDNQNTQEYSDDEDGQPLKLFSYLLAPFGWALEYGVARPLHYLATDTFLAPVLGANVENDGLTVQPIAELPPPDEITEPTGHHDTVITPEMPPPPSATAPAASAQSTAPPGNQPALQQ